ncbi:hypothetical protein C2G38_2031504 [Gigaspora rosea]|uniref:Uncharacterized protein n=1 Tax=Gigaspora rosea TaxID=44941 RepID=A0A397VSZ8_9GLOM|nr:hypothetical protein C2G38_2031504 [Gigaspora rosea]
MAASVEPSGRPLKLGTKSARVASCILIHVTNITSIQLNKELRQGLSCKMQKQKPYNISLILTIERVNSQESNNLNEPDDLIELDAKDNSDMESDSWEDQLCEWEQMLVDEETAILEDEEVEREDNEYNMSSNLLSNHTHPAIDHMAKWNLRNLFGPLFLKPKYMNIDE